MKKLSIFLFVILIVTAGSSFGIISGQSREEREKDVELQQAIEAQKKAIDAQKKAIDAQQKDQKEMEKTVREIEKNTKEWEKFKDIEVIVKDVDPVIEVEDVNPVRIFRKGGRSFSYTFPDAPDAPDIPMIHFHSFGGDTERTTWDFSKTVRDNSFKRDYSFDVEKTAKSVVISINGDCKVGDIRIKILTPDGKSYSDIVIDEFGNLNWRKSFNISETENQDKTGEWKFQISSNKATGFFRISFQTY